MNWHSKLGGRKFVLTIAGLVAVMYGIHQKADGNAYLAITGLVGAFVAGNYGVERIHGSTPPRRDSSGLPLNG